MAGRSAPGVGSRLRGAPLARAVAAAIAAAVLLGGARLTTAATYYVDNTNPTCAAGGPGTQAAPYCTISAAAAQHPGAGNTILVLAGTYREQVSIPASGAAGSPFVIQAASPAVTVDGADDFSSAAQWSPVSSGVWLAAGVTWAPKQVFAGSARLTATTIAPASMPAGTFQYVAGSGLYVNAGGGNPAGYGTFVGRRLYGFTMSGKSWITIRGFGVTRAEDKGILVQSASSQCEVSDNHLAFNFKYGIQLVGSTACLVARNVSSDNGGHGIALTSGTTGCTVEDNESCRNADPLVRVANGLYLFGAPSNVIRRNRYHHNQDSGQHLQSSSNSCVSIQNRSWSNGDHGFDHLGSIGTLHVGDVAWGNYMDGFSIEGTATGTQLFDCIATDNGLTTDEFDLWVEQTSVSGFVSDYNLFWNSTAQAPVKYISALYTSVAGYAAASGQDAHTIQADPRFTSPPAGDFRLMAGSPAIDNANSGVPSFPPADARGLARMDDPATPNAGSGPILFADRGALEFPPTLLTLSPPAGPAPLLVTADATGSLGPDGTAVSYRFDFGDGTVVGPQPGPTATHTYSPGQWTATVTVADGSGGTGTATASVAVTAGSVTTLDRRVAASADDAEEKPGASPLLNGVSLDLVNETVDQTVGMRWTGIDIPAHAFIHAAYVQFTSRDSRAEATSLTFRGQAGDNAPTFTSAISDISSRPSTVAQASWSPAAWATDQAGPDQRTPDLSAVIDEIVNRPGWASGNALAIIVTGTGHRAAYTWDSNAAAAALLHVEFAPDFPPVAGLSVRQLAAPALTVSADGSASTDADAAPIAGYRFDFGDGTPPATTTAPTATAQHTYAAAGSYTVTLTATDTRSLASTPVTARVTVNGAPTARLSVAQLPSPALTVSADASASTDPDAMPIASYRFDFGDGSPAVATTAPAATAQHTYAAAGSYTVRVTATDTGGLAATAMAAVGVDGAPVARLAATQAASPPLTVTADGSASTDPDPMPIASYRFDFGDGSPAVTTPAPVATAQHTYAAGGVYTLTLTATDTGGYTSAPATASVTVNGAPTARLSVAQAGSPPLTVTADGSASTDPDPLPIASYRFDFGDGSPAVTTTAPTATAQHTYAAAGTYTVTVVATDRGGLASAPATASAAVVAPGLEVRVASGNDDAEESATLQCITNSNDLELVFDTSNQTVGMRWRSITIPPRAIITNAYIQFAAKEAQSEATSLTLRGQAADNPAAFSTANGNVSTRPRTTAAVGWAPVPWNVGEVGPNQRTPDLSAVIQEIVNRGGWASGNALAIIVTGTGHRTAWSYNGNTSLAPLLHIELAPPDAPPTAQLAVTQPASPPLTVTADGSASTDADATPIATYRFTFGDGSPAVTTMAPIAIATHTYAAPGAYTVTLIATDSAGNASVAASASVTVNPPPVPTARLTVTPAATLPLTATADGSASTGAIPIASYRFDFGDGSPAVTTAAPVATAQHTYAAAGTYTVTLVATDSSGTASSPASASVTLAAPVTLEKRIAAWIDDVEEAVATGTIYVNSADLEMTADGSVTQLDGMRWPGLAIPKGATITAAWIQFSARESQSVATNLTFQADASDNASSFGSSAFNVSTRTRTTAAMHWSPVPWVAGDAGANQRTPDMKSVVQEIVNRPGWASGNAIAIIVSGTGHRTAWAYDGNAAGAPLLHVEYTTGSGGSSPSRAGLARGPETLATLDTPGTRVAASASATLPTHLALSAARPNPVSGPVSFRLDLPERTLVRWGIYDLEGRALWTMDQELEAGSADLTWSGRAADGAHAGPGLYFARVHADNRVLIRRFVRL